MSRSRIIELLVSKLDSDDIMYQHAVSHIAYEDEQYHLMTEKDVEFKSEILIGADGINSKVAAWLNPQLNTLKEYSGHYSLGGIVKDLVINNNFVVGHNILCTSFPCKHECYTIMFYPVDLKSEGLKDWDSASDWLSQQSLEMNQIIEHIDFEQRFYLPAYESKVFSNFSAKNSCFLIGDAAHAISPMSGISASFGIEDAYHLCGSISSMQSNDYSEKMLKRSFSLKNFSRRHFTDTLHLDTTAYEERLRLMSTAVLSESAKMLAHFTQGHM